MADFIVLTKRGVIAIVGILSVIFLVSFVFKSHWDYTATLRLQEDEIKQKVKQSSPCESYTEVSRCQRCSKEELRSLTKFCMETGFKQQIQCADGTKHYLWCDISPAVEESDFWRFQAFTLVIGLMSYAVVYLRQQNLDQKVLEKINKQISGAGL